jgi:hypothetical protein
MNLRQLILNEVFSPSHAALRKPCYTREREVLQARLFFFIAVRIFVLSVYRGDP